MDRGPKIALIRFQSDYAPDVDEPLHALFIGQGGNLLDAVAGATSWTASMPVHRDSKIIWPTGACVAAFKQGPNQLTVLYVEPDTRQIHVKWRIRGQREWGGPARPLNALPTAVPGASIALASQGPNRWFAVYASVNGNLYSFKVEGSDPWSDLERLAPSQESLALPEGNVIAIEQAPGLVSVLFVPRTTHPRLHVCWRETGASAWSGPAPIHAALPAAPPGAGLAAAHLPGDRSWVFHVDDGGTLIANHVVGRNAWQAPDAVSSAGTAPPGALLAAVNQTEGQVDVFVVDANGALRVYWKRLDSGWLGPHKLTADHFARPGAAVSAARQRDDLTVVVVVGGDGRPHICWVSGIGSWQGPARMSWSRIAAANVPESPISAPEPPVEGPVGAKPAVEWEKASTRRLAQLTGPCTLNPLDRWDCYGVDLGANTEHKASANGASRLYIFSGDVTLADMSGPPEEREIKYKDPDRSPPWDADFVAYTDATRLQAGSFPLHVVSNLVRKDPPGSGFKSIYHPFTVEKLGLLGTGETPTGAFSHDGRVYVFLVAGGDGPVSYLASSSQPDQPATFALDFKFDTAKFWQVAPVVVSNADHPGLPSRSGEGLVMIGHGGFPEEAIYLAWMPLERGKRPDRSRVLFCTGFSPGVARQHYYRWSPHSHEAAPVVGLLPGYTAVSLIWLPEPAHWVLLYSLAREPWATTPSPRTSRGPIVARVAKNLTSWSDPVVIFDPDNDSLVDPQGNCIKWEQGTTWSYGAFVLNRFTRWEPLRSRVRIRFLMSLFNPYQLQLMETLLKLPDVSFWSRIVQVVSRLFSLKVLRADR